ncbi:MAG: GntR family transcriptional regulator [Betaproteobacteria bacterium]|nr:GntR family transcriptional regulator [Betaproteobacteria bacterium]
MPSQAQKAYELIEEMIVNLKLEPGQKISENLLSEQLGIGRTPIREALQRLAYEGTVIIIPRSGITISEIDMTDQFRLIEVRRELERIMVIRAAQFAGTEEKKHFAVLSTAFLKAAKTNDENLFIQTDREFNHLLAFSARNKYAKLAMSAIQAQTRRFWFLYFKHFGDLPKTCRLHADIASAIAEGNEEKAKKACDRLIDYVEDYTTRTIKAI